MPVVVGVLLGLFFVLWGRLLRGTARLAPREDRYNPSPVFVRVSGPVIWFGWLIVAGTACVAIVYVLT